MTQTVLLLENSTHGDVITNLVKGWNQHQIRLSTSIMDKERRSYDKRTTFGQQQNPMFAFLLRSIKQIHIIKTNKPLVKSGKKFHLTRKTRENTTVFDNFHLTRKSRENITLRFFDNFHLTRKTAKL